MYCVALVLWALAMVAWPAAASAPSSVAVQRKPSMDGLIAFLDETDHGTETSVDLYTVDPDTKRLSNLSEGAFHQGSPAWSPDGRYLVYWSNGNIVRRSPGGRLKLLVAPGLSGG